MKKSSNFACMLILLLFLAVVPTVNAAIVTYSGNFSGATDVTNQSISVSQFNSSLGTLLSATFVLSATMNTSAFATNDGNFRVGWDKMQYQFDLTGDTGYSSVAISASNAPSRIVGTGTAGSPFGYISITGQPSWTQAGPTLTNSNTFSESALAAFIGTGDLYFLLTTLNSDTLYAGGLQTGGLPSPAPFGVSTNVNADVSVTYNYAPVPVPPTVWLLGSGLIGLVGLRRKFIRK